MKTHRQYIKERIEKKPAFAQDLAEAERKEVEEQRPLGLRGEGDHLALRLGTGLVVDVLQVRGLAAETWPVINQLAVDLTRTVVDEGHRWAALASR